LPIHGEWAARVAEQARQLETDCYFHVATHDPKKVGARGKIASADKLTCLWADIDVADKEGAAKNYPPADLALSTLRDMSVPPSIIVHSGNGLHAYWQLTQAIDANAHADLPKAWQRYLRDLLIDRETGEQFELDQTGDLARVLRVPGTINSKGGKRVQVIECHPERRYDHVEFETIASTTTGGERAEQPQRDDAAVQITLDANANPPPAKLAAIRRSSRFRETWAHKRPDLRDQSPSGYDMALATMAATKNWTPQEIANLLVAHRRHHGDELHLGNAQKYTRTIARALLHAANTPQGSSSSGGRSKPPGQSDAAQILYARYNGAFAYDTRCDTWRAYWQGVWHPRKPVHMREVIFKNLSDLSSAPFSAGYVDGVLKLLSAMLYVDDWDADPQLIPMRNGMLDLRTRELRTHAPEFRNTWSLTFDYDPKATCEPITKWLRWAAEGDDDTYELLRSVLRVAVTGRGDLQRFAEIVGPGGTGKSTFIGLTEKLVGQRNTYTTELSQLENNRFEMAAVVAKKLCTITDAEQYCGDTSRLKALTGGDAIRIERKNRQQGEGEELPSTAAPLIVLASNDFIRSSDYSSGLERRRVTIPFERTVPQEERRDLLTEFEAFIPGLLNHALDMEADAVRHYFGNTERAVPRIAQYAADRRANTNPLVAWFQETFDVSGKEDDKVYVGRAERIFAGMIVDSDKKLYPSYVTFCKSAGYREIALNRFKRVLEDVVMNVLRIQGVGTGRDSAGSHLWGIQFKCEKKGMEAQTNQERMRQMLAERKCLNE
jgi:P4 family phage/plasmid primase-like protien